MSISGIYGANAISQAVSNQSAKISIMENSAGEETKRGINAYDFTNITPNQMFKTMNDLIKSGKMSLDESTSLMSLIPSPLAKIYNPNAPDISDKPMDFIAGLKKLIAYDEYSMNRSGVEYGNKALSALERLQGAISDINILT